MAALDAMVERATRWPRWCRERGGTAGHRQEPGSPGGRGVATDAGSRCSGPSANPTPVTFPSVWWPGCCACGTGVTDLDGDAARARVRDRISPRRTRRICCCSMICSASPTPTRHRPSIDPDARRRRLTALINTASLARTAAGAVHHRGRALDRCGQRIDAGRLPQRHPANPVDGADHLAPRISTARCTRMHSAQSIALAPTG